MTKFVRLLLHKFATDKFDDENKRSKSVHLLKGSSVHNINSLFVILIMILLLTFTDRFKEGELANSLIGSGIFSLVSCFKPEPT